MPEYQEIQTRKVISSYGGVGSIIETPQGAIKILDFDKWPFFENDLHKLEDAHIKDNRLLARLQQKNGFPNLEAFIQVPSCTANYNYKTKPKEEKKTIRAEYFPKWFYCNKCERFSNIENWWKNWIHVLEKFGEPIEKIRRSFFSSPKCFYCYNEARSKNKNDKKRRKFLFELEQVRFILTSPRGGMKDIPWEKWPLAKKNESEEKTQTGKIKLDFKNLCCESQDLIYKKSNKLSDMAGVTIECVKCKNKNTLTGLWGLKLPVFQKEKNEEENKKAFWKPVIRTSNSVYYPILIQSIFLPTEREIDVSDVNRILKWLEKGKDLEFIYEALTDDEGNSKYKIEKIEKIIKEEQGDEFEEEVFYRQKEFNFITNPEREFFPDEKKKTKDLVFKRERLEILGSFGFSNLTILKRLKVTTVQTAYTRQEPLDKDLFLSGEFEDEVQIRPKYTSNFGRQTHYLPAVESFGEGIFLSLDNEKVSNWLKKGFAEEKFCSRIDTVFQNMRENNFIRNERFQEDKNFLAKFILVHTLSHILIKELEFIVGYPATSLSERLYVNSEEMQGLLIYTVAGSEGSFGGLITQGKESRFKKILESALHRARDCASDPICYNSIDGQGAGLNIAACYSCALLPETSCEEFNGFLDRALLIDEVFGFFKEVLY
ncbi:MAG: DUF1998 domain-containing protein [Calditrichaeota bacterium]|nr:MAG: DUF1998 domain-containing protein [Calditrichota bacterium]